jgi:hypothetical protein
MADEGFNATSHPEKRSRFTAIVYVGEGGAQRRRTYGSGGFDDALPGFRDGIVRWSQVMYDRPNAIMIRGRGSTRGPRAESRKNRIKVYDPVSAHLDDIA